MIDYRAGQWGFHVSLGWRGSLAPRALTMAIPNAIITFCVATYFVNNKNVVDDVEGGTVQMVIAAFEAVMIFILYNRSRTSYNRWWEGGTLLQKTRGEWFNAYSSIMAFTSTKPEMQDQVEAYTHCLARLMSLLMCCGLQQVSPHRDRPFSILDLEGMEPESMEFLNGAPDKVEVILQWIQRSMVLHMQTGVLPVAPPILSRAFQEVSRGIVNLQNARKIADFPYPFPLAQVSMILQFVHWSMTPIFAPLAMPRGWAVLFSFFSIFVLWCLHFNALDLEFPYGDRENDLPMHDMQQDWNNSICALLDKKASQPPKFNYDPLVHNEVHIAMSDASALYVPAKMIGCKGNAVIKVNSKRKESQTPSEAFVQFTDSLDTSKIQRSCNDAQIAPTTSIANGRNLSTTSTVTSTLIQSLPIDINKPKPSPPHTDLSSAKGIDIKSLLHSSTPAASSLEMQGNDPPKLASPVFLKRTEVCEEPTKITGRDMATPVGFTSQLIVTPCNGSLGNVSLEEPKVTISLENLYV